MVTTSKCSEYRRLWGRVLFDEDDRSGAEAVAVVSHDFWQNRLGGADDAVGGVIRVGRVPVTIIGITSNGFRGRSVASRSADVTLPLSLRPQIFRTEGIGLLSGREFLATDNEKSPKVAIISESLARTFFPSENPIGKHFEFESGGGFNIKPGVGDIEIIGIARDIRSSLWEQDWLASFYLPYIQAPERASGRVELLIRASNDPAQLIQSVRREVNSIDPNLFLIDVRTQADEMDQRYLGTVRPIATLLSVFAGIALVLTIIALFGVVAFGVKQRTQELGIRMALGARMLDILRLVVGHGMKLTGTGIGAGLLMSFMLTRLLKSMLFGVSASDPLTFSALAVLLLCVSVLACYVPARRATRVDPIEALRYE